MGRNEQNLRRLTSEEAREIGRKGAAASVKARREKKYITQTLKLLLDSQLSDDNLIEELKAKGFTEYTELTAMTLSMIKEARRNPTAFKEIIDRVEGKVIDKMELEQTKPFEVNIKVVD